MSSSRKLSPASVLGPLLIGGRARVARELPGSQLDAVWEGELSQLGVQYDLRIGMVACLNEAWIAGGAKTVDIIWPEGEEEEVARDLVTAFSPDEELLTPLAQADFHREAGNLLFREGRHVAAACEYVESLAALGIPLNPHGTEASNRQHTSPRSESGGGNFAPLFVGSQVHVAQKDGTFRPGMIACIESGGGVAREMTLEIMYDDDLDPDEETGVTLDRVQRGDPASVALTAEEELKRIGFTNLGRCLMSIKWWKGAACAASAALILDPRHAKALFLRAQARIKLGKFAEARQDLLVLKSLSPRDPAGDPAVRRVMQELREAKRKKAEADRAFFAEVLGLARRAHSGQSGTSAS